MPTLAKAQVAAGADGIFIETHPNPGSAQCDSQTQWPLNEMADLIKKLRDIYYFVKNQ